MVTPADFLAMHRQGAGFVLPNAWDPGSARILEQLGFPVVATTSAGIAFAHGRPDGQMTGPSMLAGVAAIVDAVTCPVTADLEAGYGATPDAVSAVIAEAVSIGAVGANIEDRDPATGTLYPKEVAADRLAAARSAAPTGTFVLNARIDSYLVGVADPYADTLERAERYVTAGADCIFVPGIDDPTTIRSLVDAVGAPLNVVVGLTERVHDAAALRSLGVARISTGGSLARAALAFVERAGRDLLAGRFDHVHDALPHRELQHRFVPRP